MSDAQKYRPDIDGLRTLAVAPVVFYHAGVAPFTGGYIGVDVFFVISGYLITSILKADLDVGRYSLRRFYERRARRILPALVTCILATVVGAALVLPPSDMAGLGRSIPPVALFLSNFYFWGQGGYFQRDTEEHPLLHTWSLGVEEQFYIVWPLLLALLIYRLPRTAQLGALVGLVLISLLAAIWKNGDRPTFFLLPFRAWELGLGALLGLRLAPEIGSRLARQIVSALGLLLILAPVFIYTRNTPFPGYAAIPPCLGTALLIHGNQRQDTVAARFLAWKPMVGVGLISYSLYLWHWPILVLSRIALNRPLTLLETGLGILAATAGAFLSWRYVEAPFRKPGVLKIGNTAILAGSAASLAAVALLGSYIVATHGAAWRASPRTMQAELAVASINPRRDACHLQLGQYEPPPQAKCSSAAPRRYDVLVWGDSHADHFAPAVDEWARQSGMTSRQASKSGCRPLLTQRVDFRLGIESSDCVEFNRRVLSELAATPSTRLVVMSGYWPADERLVEVMTSTFARIREAHKDIPIVVLGSTPSFGFWPSLCLARARFNHLNEEKCVRGVASNSAVAAKADRRIAEAVARMPGVRFVPLWDALCSGANCLAIDNDVVLMRDHNHLTLAGAERVLLPRLQSATGDLPRPQVHAEVERAPVGGAPWRHP